MTHQLHSEEISRHAQAAWTLSGQDPALFAEWCLQRIEQGLGDAEEHRFLLGLIAAADAQMKVPLQRITQFLKANKTKLRKLAEEEEQERIAKWDRRCEALIERENARRSAPKPANWCKSFAEVA